ncbi:MAG TPA: hypothetical protein VGC76_04480 [Pyrinomonadaceae bacterium]|jgi:hypothetical protein
MIKVRNFSQCKYFLSGNRKFIFFGLLLFIFQLSVFSFSVYAQTEEPKDAEPPPLKMISKDEKARLQAETDLKARTDLSLALMEARLKKAEEFSSQEAYSEMFTELGGFHALIDDTLSFLNRNDNGSRKVLNNFKKIEISLRSFISRLEIIRRELPAKFEFYVRGLVKIVRDARTRAVEPLFSDTVVPNVEVGPNVRKDN